MNWASKNHNWRKYDELNLSSIVEGEPLKFNNKKMVNKTDVSLMSLALADFALISQQLVAHDYYVAGGLLVVGVVLVFLYHKFGSQTS